MTDTTRRYKSGREDWGTIRKLTSGRFQASYLGPDGTRHNAPMPFTAKTDARAFLSRTRTDVERGTWKNPKAITTADTFGVYAATWVEQRTSSKGEHLRPKTRSGYVQQLGNGLSHFAGDRLTDITPARVRTWHGERMKSGKTQAGSEARLLRAILNTAIEDRIIGANPVPAKLTKSSSGRSYRPPTPDELAVLVEGVEDRFRLGVLIAAYAGLRLSEWRALRRRDLELVDGRYIIAVTRQAHHIAGQGWIIGEPKSAHGIRAQVLPVWMTGQVSAHLDARVGSFPDSLVFAPKGRAEFFHDSDFNRTWNTARDAAGVRGEVREHDLRSFAGSHLVAVGANAFEARDFLGHANVRTTEQHYVRKVNDRAAELADRMPRLPQIMPSTAPALAVRTGTIPS